MTNSSAVISTDEKYRYLLRREFGGYGRTCVFVMLNPSTADADEDDPTIRRCNSFARRENCSALEVVNLYAYRSTDPKQLWQVFDPVGPENDRYIREAVANADVVIAAWGAHAKRMRARVVDRMIPGAFALGFTKQGSPKHPLYIKADAPLISLHDRTA